MSAARSQSRSERTPSSGGAPRRVGGWLGLLLLLFNAVIGPLAVGDGSADHPLPFAAEFAGDTVICTAQGMLVLDRDGHLRTPTGQAGHDGFCVFCLPLAHIGSGHAPALAMVPLPEMRLLAVVRPDDVSPPDIRRHRDPNPARAPPIAT